MTEDRSDAGAAYRITGVALTDTTIVLTLADGHTVTEPLQSHVRLEKATGADRERWQATEHGHGVNWPQLWDPTADGMVNVWDILQDRLYAEALNQLQGAHWDIDAISPHDRDLVALWRAEADVNNGGFLQFLGNWGVDNHRTAVAALDTIGATATADILRAMFTLVEPYLTAGIESFSDIYALLTDPDTDRLEELDESFWEYPDPLSRLVVEHHHGHRDCLRFG